MSDQQQALLSPETVVEAFKKNGVTHVVWLPDSETNWLYQLMLEEPSLHLVPVSREGFAIPIAAGLLTGGKKPVVLIQNTGMMESGDSIRGWGLGLDLPLVLLIGYRGWTRHGANADDDVAVFTEPILTALGIKYYLVETNEDGERINLAFERAERTHRPVAVLVGDEFHGFNR
jgi:sulfopyruvate decarboxylase subunit alpha